MKRYLTSDIWLILLLTIVVAVIWLDIQATKELSNVVKEQNSSIEKLNDSLTRWVDMWEAPSGEGVWEAPEDGKKKGQ